MEKHASGKSLNLQDRITDGWSPAPLAVGPDGVVGVTEPKPAPPVQRSICQRGPCRNYHRMVVEADADAVTGQPTQVVHTCYPALGIEIDLQLGDGAVFECSRWDPEDPEDYMTSERLRRRREYEEREAAQTAPVPAPTPKESPE